MKELKIDGFDHLDDKACYSESKRMAETIVKAYHDEFGIEANIVRLFNVYGPGMTRNDGRVIPEFINNIINKKPCELEHTGKQTRSFCYVDDAVDGLIKAMNFYSEEFEVFNIGNSDECYKIDEVLDIVVDNMVLRGYDKPTIKTNGNINDDSAIHRKPNTSKAKMCLGFNPTVNFNTGLNKTIDYFEKFYK
jgi:nucleoside-diphosphate-sugar epimerase